MAISPVRGFSRCQFYFVLITSASNEHDGLDTRQMAQVYSQKLKHVYESEKETKEKDGDRTDSKRWGDRDSESCVMAREWVAPQRVMCRKVNSECDSIKK